MYEPHANILKATEGGLGVSVMVAELKRHGIKAMSAHSCYVGHSLLMIKRGQLRQAKRILRKAFGDY